MRVGLAIVVGCVVVVGGARMVAQQQAARVMGTVATKDALVTGGLEVKGDRARLMSNASVTAYDHTAQVKLERGGEVLVCATSQFHLLHSGTGNGLLFGLDRGAIELHTPTEGQDVILTPDIRFSVESKGSYDLRMRVTRDGDTCVENVGKKAPVLMLNDAFSRASYRLMAGQHVLFEHGSLKEVVDSETSSCGCPSEPVMTVADALVNAGTPGAAGNGDAAKTAAEQHPFPAAVSEGLAPAAAVPQSPAGVVHAQVTATLNSGDGADSTTEPQAAAGRVAAPVSAPTAVAQPPAAAQPAAPRKGVFHAIGRFFRRLVGQ